MVAKLKEGDVNMVPLIIAGMAAARLVTPIIAKKLLREGLAKAAPKAARLVPLIL